MGPVNVEMPPEGKRVDGRTITWGVVQASVEKIESTLDIIYDLGDIGKEPMVFLFGPTVHDVSQHAVKVANESIRRRGSNPRTGYL